MSKEEWLARQFEAHRPRLRAAAYRMLGSHSDADDAVQEAWIRVSRADTSSVENPAGWLTTVVARVCLNQLQARKSRREAPVETIETIVSSPEGGDPEQQAVQADMVGVALLVVLDTLTPAERLAFVLHDVFDLPFDEISPIVERSPAAARQLASRARRRVQGSDPESGADLVRQQKVVSAFLAASRTGDFAALLDLLDPDAVARSDAAAVAMGSPAQLRGATAVAQMFSGRARAAQAALIDGAAGAVWAHAGTPRVVFAFTISDGKIVAIDLLADAARLAELDLELLAG